MARVVRFTFNPFQENTYLVIDQTKQCALFDPGCASAAERDELARYIDAEELQPVRLINTHCHLDHIFGNAFVARRYGLELEIHRQELPVLQGAPASAQLFGIDFREELIEPGRFLAEGQEVVFGHTRLQVLLTPGHSPGSLSFYHAAEGFLISGDVIFQGSIGRTDLPGGDMATLLRSIREKLLPLGDEVVVHSGHGPDTTIGHERRTNPFLTEKG